MVQVVLVEDYLRVLCATKFTALMRSTLPTRWHSSFPRTPRAPRSTGKHRGGPALALDQREQGTEAFASYPYLAGWLSVGSFAIASNRAMNRFTSSSVNSLGAGLVAGLVPSSFFSSVSILLSSSWLVCLALYRSVPTCQHFYCYADLLSSM